MTRNIPIPAHASAGSSRDQSKRDQTRGTPNSSVSSSPRVADSPQASSSSSSPSSTSSPILPDSKESPRPAKTTFDRRPSLLGSSLSKQEHTVINVGDPNGVPRLISYVKTSQGFDWNQEIFLPSHSEHLSADLERRQDPVHEIRLSEADIKELLPE